MGRIKRKWNYCSIGGVVRVNITSGDDIAHLGELNQKSWTVLSCPVDGLHFDRTTLGLLDSDGDGKIRVPEVVAAARWLTDAIKDDDTILSGSSSLPLDQIDTSNDTGRTLHDSAKRILEFLGKNTKEISIEDTIDVVEASVLRARCNDYASWVDAGTGSEILPYGGDTGAAMDACDAVSDKMADWYMRCKLISFDADVAAAVDVSVDKVCAISGENLASHSADISTYPLARPSADALLPLNALNPAWQGAFDTLRKLVLDSELGGSDTISESQWNAILAKFGPYRSWKASAKGLEVQAMGIDKVREVLANGAKGAALGLDDKAIGDVNKLLHYYRDFYRFLKNYVIFSDFYSWEPDDMAMFEAGTLFIDQRCCKLCINVSDMSKHADMAGLSGMFLIYCKCTSKVKNSTMDIVAVMTAGSVKNLRVGKNAVFYDRDGLDWDAVVTKIVDNPINIRQAFWSPYIKFWEFCKGLIDKSAKDKESQMISDMQSTASAATASSADKSKPKAFDIAKFAGIFAAIGMALGYIGSFVTKVVAGVTSTPLWITALLLVAIMLCISGPSCFIAWGKLRKRNLGPVLNANGWAINSIVPVNILFGATLTSTAEYPKLNLSDPFKKKVPLWKKIVSWLTLAVIAAFCFFYFTNRLESIGLPFHPEKIQEVVSEVGSTLTEQVQAAVETAVDSTLVAPVATGM